MSALEICQRIVAIDTERRELETALFRAEAWRESDR
jgi:hypothetical protein